MVFVLFAEAIVLRAVVQKSVALFFGNPDHAAVVELDKPQIFGCNESSGDLTDGQELVVGLSRLRHF